MDLNLGNVWSRAMALVSANLQYLALISGIFLLVPNLILYVALPDFMALAMTPGGDPEQLAEAMLDQVGPLVGLGLLTTLASFVGYAAMVALIGPERLTVGEALRAGLRALPTMIGCLLIAIVGYFVLALSLGLVIGLIAAALSAIGGEVLAAVLAVVLGIVAIGYILSRLCVMMPVIVHEKVGNPFAVFGRSWKLTGPAAWRIFGFFVLLLIVYFVLSLLLLIVMGVLASVSGGVFVIGIVSGVVSVAVGMVLCGIVVALHEQLGSNSLGTADVFD